MGKIEGIGAYILRVLCCAFLVSLLRPIGGGGKAKELCCGLFLLFGVLFPLRELHLELPQLPGIVYEDGQAISREAAESAQHQIADGIIARTRAYILEEAGALGLDVSVVSLSLDEETMTPDGVELAGEADPFARSAMEEYLENTLGIDREAQIWTP